MSRHRQMGEAILQAQQTPAAPKPAQPRAPAAPGATPAPKPQAAPGGADAGGDPLGGPPPLPNAPDHPDDKSQKKTREHQLWIETEGVLKHLSNEDLQALADAINEDSDVLGQLIGETLATKSQEAPTLQRELAGSSSRIARAIRFLTQG